MAGVTDADFVRCDGTDSGAVGRTAVAEDFAAPSERGENFVFSIVRIGF